MEVNHESQAESLYNALYKLSLDQLIVRWIKMDLDEHRKRWIGIVAGVTIAISLLIGFASLRGSVTTFLLGGLVAILIMALIWILQQLNQ